MDDNSNIQAAIDAGMALAVPRTLAGFKPYTVVPDGMGVELLDPEPDYPHRVKAHPQLHDPLTFANYFNKFASGHSSMFADEVKCIIQGIIDYHESEVSADNETGARYCDHRVTFTGRKSPEWIKWNGIHARYMGQVEFAEFIEDNAANIISHEAADLMEMALDMSATKGCSFNGKAVLQSNSSTFSYSEEVNGTTKSGVIEIPRTITLSLRPFIGMERIEVAARFRYKLESSQLLLSVHLLQTETLLREAFDRIVADIGVATKANIYLGTI